MNFKKFYGLFLGSLFLKSFYMPLLSMEEKSSFEVPLVSETMDLCDLTRRETLIPLMDPAFQENEPLIRLGLNLFTSQTIRDVGNSRYGQTFPLNPEILQELAPLVKGKTVFEVAGGPCGNGIFAALCGAEKVYVNDIVPEEMTNLKEKLIPLPKEFKQKFRIVTGDFFELPESLNGAFDIIYARNFLHLLSGDKIPLFYSKLRDLLKPEGQIIVSAHGKWNSNEQKWSPSSRVLLGYFVDENKKNCIHSREEGLQLKLPTEEKGDPLKYNKNFPIKIENGKLLFNKEEADSMSKIQNDFLRSSMERIFLLTNKLKAREAHFTVLESFINLYSPVELCRVTRENGFAPEKVFVTKGTNGHVSRLGDINKNPLEGNFLTVFAKLA